MCRKKNGKLVKLVKPTRSCQNLQTLLVSLLIFLLFYLFSISFGSDYKTNAQNQNNTISWPSLTDPKLKVEFTSFGAGSHTDDAGEERDYPDFKLTYHISITPPVNSIKQ